MPPAATSTSTNTMYAVNDLICDLRPVCCPATVLQDSSLAVSWSRERLEPRNREPHHQRHAPEHHCDERERRKARLLGCVPFHFHAADRRAIDLVHRADAGRLVHGAEKLAA